MEEEAEVAVLSYGTPLESLPTSLLEASRFGVIQAIRVTSYIPRRRSQKLESEFSVFPQVGNLLQGS